MDNKTTPKHKLPLMVLAIITATGCGSKGENGAKLSSFPEPELGMTMGRGYDPTHPLEVKGDCIANVDAPDVTIVSWKDANGINGSFSETKITSSENLRKELSVSASVAGETLWGGGGASFSKFEKFRADQNAFTWMVNYVVDSGEKTINLAKVTLTPQAKSLVDAGKLDAFYKMCGTEFIRSIRFGGKFTEVMEIDAKQTEYVESITASASGHMGVGAFGYSGSASFRSFLDDAKFRSVLTREIQQIGGSALGTGISPDNLSEYLANFAGQLRTGEAKPIKIETASWDTLGITGLNPFADMHRKETMDALYTQYRANKLILDRINDYNYYASNSIYVLAQSDLDNELNPKKNRLEAQQTLIAQKAGDCLDLNKCDASGLDVIAVKFPFLQKKGVEDEFGGLTYQMPLAMANYGTDQQYDGKLARLFFLPGSLTGVTGVFSVDLILSQTPCTDKDDLIAKDKAALSARALTVTTSQAPESNIPGGQISWWENNANAEFVLERNQQSGMCMVLRVAARGKDVNINHLGNVSDGIKMFLRTAHY